MLLRHLACEEERTEIAELLIENGASTTVTNKVQFFIKLKYQNYFLLTLVDWCIREIIFFFAGI